MELRVPMYAVTLNKGTHEYETEFMLKNNGNGLWIPVINEGYKLTI